MSGSRGRARVAAVSFVTALAALAAAPAWPVPGGGAGGAGMPSQTGPAYDPAAEYKRGVEALQARNFADAERAFQRVVDAAPDYADGHYLLGLARQAENKLKPARRAFQNALKKDKNHIGARAQLGVTLAKMGEMDDAREELDVLEARAAACAETCKEAADLAAAVSAVEAAIGAGPQAALTAPAGLRVVSAEAGDTEYLDAVALINEGRYEDAITALGAAEQAFGPHPDVLTYLGFANRKLGRLDAAERYYGLALAADPTHRGATEYLGEMRVEQGRLAEAEALLGKLDAMCDFGCAEADELRRWIAAAS